jgi:hypothetical protein
MIIHLRRSIQLLILLALLLTPLFNIGEVVSLLRGATGGAAVGYTPTSVKAAKDLLLLLIAFLCMVSTARSGRTNRLAVPFVVLALYVTAVALLAGFIDPRLPMAGLRWILPIFLAFLLIDQVDEELLRRMARVLALLLLMHVFAQLLQLLFMGSFYGVTVFGLAARVPGIFFMPNTAGFFAITCLYFAACHLPAGRLRRTVYLLTPLSVVLTQSGTALIVLTAFAFLLYLGPRRMLALAPAAPFLLLGMLALLPLLTGRGGDYVQISGGTRVKIFADLIVDGEVLPRMFGFATNTAVALSSAGLAAGTDGPIIADSTYSSILGNLGLVGLVVLLASAGAWGVLLLREQRMDLYAFTLIFALYGFTIIIMEAYPMSLILSILAAYYIDRTALRARSAGARVPRAHGPGRHAPAAQG